MTASFTITETTISHLNACAAQGLCRTDAAGELGVSIRTLLRAVERQNLQTWFQSRFPPQTGTAVEEFAEKNIGPRWLKPEQILVPLNIDWTSPYVRSAAMKWRKVV